MKSVVVLVLLVFALTACHPRLGPYTSPRIIGRVLSADSRQPLPQVTVRRDQRERRSNTGSPPKGGELLLATPTAHTGPDGTFSFSSERALTIFRPGGWDVISLSFEHTGYERYQTNFSILTAGTNSPTGEPIVETGDILLHPAGR